MNLINDPYILQFDLFLNIYRLLFRNILSINEITSLRNNINISRPITKINKFDIGNI